jgi:hypothetical protein
MLTDDCCRVYVVLRQQQTELMQVSSPSKQPLNRSVLIDSLPPNIEPLLPPSTAPESACPKDPQIIAMTGSTNEPLGRILYWMRYHQIIGFSVFYLFVEGMAADPAVVDVLRSLVGVKARYLLLCNCILSQHSWIEAPGHD